MAREANRGMLRYISPPASSSAWRHRKSGTVWRRHTCPGLRQIELNSPFPDALLREMPAGHPENPMPRRGRPDGMNLTYIDEVHE